MEATGSASPVPSKPTEVTAAARRRCLCRVGRGGGIVRAAPWHPIAVGFGMKREIPQKQQHAMMADVVLEARFLGMAAWVAMALVIRLSSHVVASLRFPLLQEVAPEADRKQKHEAT